MMKRINIFWTGGLDSTFRVLELSTMPDVEIQPYYLNIPTRRSAFLEIKAAKQMTKIIRQMPNYNGHLLDLKAYNLTDFTYYDDIHTAREKQRKIGYSVGWQYCYCGDFCRHFGIRCEVCLENEETCSGHKAIMHETVLAENDFDYYIDKTKSKHNNIYTIFENIDFPKSVFTMTKQQEIEYIKSVQPEILNHLQICHRTINGVPCGVCTPCKQYIKLGLLDNTTLKYKTIRNTI